MRNRTVIIGAAIVVVVLVGVAVGAVLLSGGLGETAAGNLHPGPGGTGATPVVMRDNTFEPASIQATAATPTAFELTNAGQANHNFTSTALGVSTGPMKPGDVATLTVTLPAGTTQFVCTFHSGMTISVQAN